MSKKIKGKGKGKGKGAKVQGKQPPAKYVRQGAVKPEHYADPKNWKYPIFAKDPKECKKTINAAIHYLSVTKNASKYSPQELKIMWRRIINAARKNGIEVSDKVARRAGMAKSLDVSLFKSMVIESSGGTDIPSIDGFIATAANIIPSLSDSDLLLLLSVKIDDRLQDFFRYNSYKLEDLTDLEKHLTKELIRMKKEFFGTMTSNPVVLELMRRLGVEKVMDLVDYIFTLKFTDQLAAYGLLNN